MPLPSTEMTSTSHGVAFVAERCRRSLDIDRGRTLGE